MQQYQIEAEGGSRSREDSSSIPENVASDLSECEGSDKDGEVDERAKVGALTQAKLKEAFDKNP